MCENCDWEYWEEKITEAIDEGMESEFCENILHFIGDRKHITDKQKEGVDRWIDNWHAREDR